MDTNDFVSLAKATVGIRHRPDGLTPKHLRFTPVVVCEPGMSIVLSEEIVQSNIFEDGEESAPVDFVCVKHYKSGVVWVEKSVLTLI